MTDQVSSAEKTAQDPQLSVPFSKLFRFASTTDKLLMAIGGIAASINGFALPAFSFIFGQMIDQFRPGNEMDQLVHNAGVQSMWFAVIGSVSFVLSFIQMSTWMITGENQTIRYRRAYFSAILRQEVGWFDQTDANQLSTKISTECLSIQGAISDKVTTCIMSSSMFFAGFIVAYLRGWRMSLIVTAALPIMFLGGFIIGKIMKKSEGVSQSAYASAGGSAEQTLNAIKTVKSLNGEDFELAAYSSRLISAFKSNVRFGAFNGFGIGIVFCTMFLCYALSFWYGGTLIDDDTENTMYGRPYSAGDVVIVFFCILTGSFQLGSIAPCFKDFIKGQQAAKQVFDVLDRTPKISSAPDALKLINLKGNIELANVGFSYPTKPDTTILNDISFQINSHQKTALVGESGCGKSTIMQLIERFYDPTSGSVKIDGVDVKQLDLKWMRNQIGYVGQEPVLFAATIRENLQFGNSSASDEEMIGALKQANAWEFVSKLDKTLDTYVGNMGNQFSGGQKQRLCIARAILKSPQILLLDEATSSLDRKNEKEIQETLDYVSSGRTTLVIAHRLQTVQNADMIYVMDQGQLVQKGTYQQLMSQEGGRFAGMAKNQILKQAEIEEINENVEQEEQLEDSKQFLRQSINSVRSHRDSKIHVALPAEKTDLERAKDQKELEKQEKEFIKRLFGLNKPERGLFILGILVTLCNGTGFPFAGLILAEFIAVLSNSSDDDFMSQVYRYSLYFIILAISILILYTLQIYLFTRVGEALTFRIRVNTFQKMIQMPCSWFDRDENTPGSLASRLSLDCQLINKLTTTVMAVQFQNLSTLICGITFAFVASWQVTLVGLGMMPVMIIAGVLQAKFAAGKGSSPSDKAYKGSGNIITDSVTNIRTVASFANEQKIMDMFEKNQEFSQTQIVKKGMIQGFLFGFSQLSMFAVYAVIFYVSAIFVRDHGVSIKDMYISMFCILFAGMGAGSNNAFAGDIGSAKNACRSIFAILDSEDEIQQQKRLHNSQERQLTDIGRIAFSNVSFKYLSRDTAVFKNLSFSINAGEHAAFVGPSGCGKSTILQILLRFYDEYTGIVTINGVDIRQYNINSLRSNFGVIFQDPILFDTTFKANIEYNTPNMKMEDIQQAARDANALSFIEGHESTGNERFERKVGLKGCQISGGQKQRIAVARAILKKPRIMLLDEATSALDSKNEKILQEALEKVLKGKTSITIAHRIHTIQNSDIIFVMQDGKIMEKGNYDQLMGLNGFFKNMNTN